jgi:tetratricopeptide (TPR) repeat protein
MSLARPRRFSLFLVPLLLLAFAGGAGSAGAWLWANHHFQAGRQALQRHRLTLAREHFRLCLKVLPNDAQVHLLAGRAARRALDFREARKHFKECERIGGQTPALALEEGLLRVQQGDVERSGPTWLREVDKGHVEAPLILEALVEGYMQVHRLSDAIVCIERWEKLEQNNLYFYLLRASIREQIPNFEPAASDYRRVLELNPDYQPARLGLARMLLELHECAEALQQLEILRQLQPDNPTVLVLMARCYLDLAQPEKARQALDQALALDPKNQPALVISAKLALQEGAPEWAETLVRQALAIDPYERQANFLFEQCLRQTGKIAQADEQLAKLKRLEADWNALHEITTIKMGAAPQDPELAYQAGVLLMRLGDESNAVQWLQRALQINPNHAPSHRALADYYERIGNRTQAASHRAKAEGPAAAVAGTERPTVHP